MQKRPAGSKENYSHFSNVTREELYLTHTICSDPRPNLEDGGQTVKQD